MDAALKQRLIKDTTERDIPTAYRPIVDIVGVDKFIDLSEYVRGDKLYIPKPEHLLKAARDRYIKEQYNGRNLRELATACDLTPNQVTSILKDAPVVGQYSLKDWALQLQDV